MPKEIIIHLIHSNIKQVMDTREKKDMADIGIIPIKEMNILVGITTEEFDLLKDIIIQEEDIQTVIIMAQADTKDIVDINHIIDQREDKNIGNFKLYVFNELKNINWKILPYMIIIKFHEKTCNNL